MKKSVLSIITGCLSLLVVLSLGFITFATGTNVDSSSSTSSNENIVSQATENTKKGKKSKSGVHVNVISVAASVLGKTEDEVKEVVKTGKVGDLLVEAGKVEEFKTTYLVEMKQKLDAAVTDGKITQEQADAKYSASQEKMSTYDGTTHLCGGTDHSKMDREKSSK